MANLTIETRFFIFNMRTSLTIQNLSFFFLRLLLTIFHPSLYILHPLFPFVQQFPIIALEITNNSFPTFSFVSFMEILSDSNIFINKKIKVTCQQRALTQWSALFHENKSIKTQSEWLVELFLQNLIIGINCFIEISMHQEHLKYVLLACTLFINSNIFAVTKQFSQISEVFFF